MWYTAKLQSRDSEVLGARFLNEKGSESELQ